MKIAFLLLISALSARWLRYVNLPSEERLDALSSQFGEALRTNSFSELMTNDTPVFFRTIFKMLSLQTGTFSSLFQQTVTDEPLIKKRSFQFHASLIEEIIFLFLKFKNPYFDLDILKEVLHEYEVNINDETMAEFLPLLPPKSSPRLVLSVYPRSRPMLQLHGCKDPSNRSLTCFRIKVVADINGKDISAFIHVEFYFRNTLRFVRPYVTSITFTPSDDPYDKYYFKAAEMTKFANKCLLIATNGINYTLSEKYEDLIPTIQKTFKTIRVNQRGDAYVIDFDLS